MTKGFFGSRTPVPSFEFYNNSSRNLWIRIPPPGPLVTNGVAFFVAPCRISGNSETSAFSPQAEILIRFVGRKNTGDKIASVGRVFMFSPHPRQNSNVDALLWSDYDR
jgi:hypothetical protein